MQAGVFLPGHGASMLALLVSPDHESGVCYSYDTLFSGVLSNLFSQQGVTITITVDFLIRFFLEFS